jgi:OmpA-like transmembrane domain
MNAVAWCRIILLQLFLVGATATAAAAQPFEIRGPAGMDVFVVTEKGRTPLVTLDSDGRGTARSNALPDGKELEVLIETCEGKMVAVLVERGRNDEACDDAPPFSGRCKCVRPGVFLTAGRLQRLTISGSGQVSIEGQAEQDREGVGWGVGWLAGADFGWASLSDADAPCDTARTELESLGLTASCNSDTTVDAWGADLTVTFLKFGAVKAGYLDIGRVSLIASGAAPPVSAVVNAQLGRIRGVTLTGGLRFPIGRFVPYADAGVWRWSAESSAIIDLTGPVPFSTSFSEDNNGWDPVFAVGAEFWPLRNLGIIAGARFVRIQADELPGIEADSVSDSFRMVFVGLKFGLR